MSLLVLTTAGLGALWLKSTNKGKKVERPKPKKSEVAEDYLHTGTYGDISTISNTIHKPGFIVDERFDVDLSGAPCRWLTARNRGVYKTYDLHTQFIN